MAAPSSASAIISTVLELEAFLRSLPSSKTIYLDLEGESLSRHGTLSLITLLIHPQEEVRVIDVLALGASTFTVASNDGTTLKSILEAPDIPKYVWDVRNDADALWAHYNVGLAGVTDLQLLENVSRAGDKTYVRGLDTCVKYDLVLGWLEKRDWLRTKEELRSLMPTGIFSHRPMDTKTLQYCVNDVVHLPKLHAVYSNRAGNDGLRMVIEESERRVTEARSPE
ncbi:MAG: hypothetical protein Q9157_004694 [Trypethelium eluteriae]